MTERDLMRQIQLRASQIGWRLFRNNVGMGWIGTPCERCKQIMRPIRFGLTPGSSDLIGWNTKGQFVAREIKKPGGYATEAQLNFIAAVMDAGGDARVIRSPEELR